MKIIFLNYLLFLVCVLGTVFVLDYLSSMFLSLLKTVYDIRDFFKFRKLDKSIEEEKVNNNEYDMDQGWWCNMKKRIIKL